MTTADRAREGTAPEEAAANADVGRRHVIVHPLLMAVGPVLLLYSHNMHELRPSELLLPIGLAVGAAAVLWCLLSAILRDGARAAVLCSFFWLWFFACGHVNSLLTGISARQAAQLASAPLFLLPYTALLAAGIYVIARQRALAGVLHQGLNATCVLLLLWHLVGMTHFEWRRAIAHRLLPQSAPIRVVRPAGPTPPSIYYIVLDEYARADVLEDLYGLDNTSFLSYLRAKGFHVAEGSRANYSFTPLSLASTLNLEYLEGLAALVGTESGDRQPLTDSILGNRLFRFLKQHGYSTVVFDSGYRVTDITTCDVRLAPAPEAPSTALLSEFQICLLDTTPIPLLVHLAPASVLRRGPARAVAEAAHVQRVVYALEQLPATTSLDGPLFVFAHILCPHAPFVFDRRGVNPAAKGELTGPESGHCQSASDRSAYRARYREQVLYVNRTMMAVVDALMRNTGGNAVIVIAADHGPGSGLDWESLERTDLRERMTTLLAYYLPGGPDDRFDHVVTPVNMFRLVLDRYFGTDLGMLPDESYYSTYSHPYRFVRVTDRLATTAAVEHVQPPLPIAVPLGRLQVEE